MSTTSLMTFAEFEQLPEMPGKQELVDGEFILMPPPDNQHSLVSIRLIQLLLDGLPAGRVRADHTGYRMGEGWVEPDASITWPDQKTDGKYLVGAPMLAVEILSPGEEIDSKLTLYFSEGAQEVWVMNIKHNSMTVYLRRSEQVIRTVVKDQYHSETAQVSVRLAELFALSS